MEQELINASQAARLAGVWIERNQDVTSDLKEVSPQLLLTADMAVNTVAHSAHNLLHRPVIGLFGASQAGKSYLVSSLAAGHNAELTTRWDQDEINFIRHVNPSGNNSEATGFATRFTHAPSRCPEGFPVELKLLNEMELVMIMINAFFADINSTDVTVTAGEDEFLARLASLEPWVDQRARQSWLAYPKEELQSLEVAASAQAVLDYSGQHLSGLFPGRRVSAQGISEMNYVQPEQITELSSYVGSNSQGKLSSWQRMPRLWLKLREMLPFMPLAGRVAALSMFWQDLPIFSETYRGLAQELLKFKGHQVVYAIKESFVTSDGQGGLIQNSGGTIMHITRLGTMFRDTAELDCALARPALLNAAAAKSGQVEASEVECMVAANVSRLAALSLELTFNLTISGGLDEFDVIDLPGARSRDVVMLRDVVDDGSSYDAAAAARDPATLSEAFQMRGSEFFRRGKVAFLFDRYARHNEIDQLLFCIGVNAQQDVTTVLTILTDWIERNVGVTPAQRSSKPNPLTIVLTRYDEVFNRQLRNLENHQPIDMKQEVNIALNRIQKLNWFNDWVPGRPFDRILLARKPNLGELNPWIESDPATKAELKIKDSALAGIEQIKSELLKVTDFTSHIQDLETALDSVLKLNDGGVDGIVAAIKENTLPDESRVSAHSYKAVSVLQELSEALSGFADRASDAVLDKARQSSQKLSLNLLQCNAVAPCFDLLRGLLEMDEGRLEEIYQQGFSAGSNVQRFVIESCAEYLNNLNELTRKDNLTLNRLADRIVGSYLKMLPNLEADVSRRQSFSFCFNQAEQRFKNEKELKEDILDLFTALFAEIKKAFNSPQIGLKNNMVRVLLAQENVNEGYGDIVRSQVQLMNMLLSDFNLYLGTNLLPTAAAKAALSGAAAAAATASAVSAAAAPAPAGAAAAAAGDAGADDDFGDMDFSGIDFDDDNDFGTPVAPVAAAPTPAGAGGGVGAGGSATRGSRLLLDSTTMLAAQIKPSAELKPGQSVLGNKEGPVNRYLYKDGAIAYDPKSENYEVFSAHCTPDDTGVLPHLDSSSAGFEFRLISDFVSCLSYVMCQVNIAVKNKYQFSAEENLLLCQILNSMENCH